MAVVLERYGTGKIAETNNSDVIILLVSELEMYSIIIVQRVYCALNDAECNQFKTSSTVCTWCMFVIYGSGVGTGLGLGANHYPNTNPDPNPNRILTPLPYMTGIHQVHTSSTVFLIQFERALFG